MVYRAVLILVVWFTSTLVANEIKSLTKQPYATGYRINIDASIYDKKGVEEARVYFKSSQEEPYQVFAKMKCKKKLCRAVLPMPKASTYNIYYKIIYKNNIAKVYQGKEYLMYKKEILSLQTNQTKDRKPQILYTDLYKAPRLIKGFGGNYTIRSILKNNKLGVLTGFVPQEKAGILDKSTDINASYNGWAAEGLSAGIVGGIILFLMFF